MVISTSPDSAYNSAAFMSYTASASSTSAAHLQSQPSFPHPHQNQLLQNHPQHLYHQTSSQNAGIVNAAPNTNNRNYPPKTASANTDWDINDTHVPHISPGGFTVFDEWVDGHQRCVYPADSEEARKHTSGWAMRNTNNHNVNILKKSCLGVLVCSLGCRTTTGDSVHLRPAICDKARRKQQGKMCPNRSCKGGRLEVRPCRGHCGYPVTHFWRHVPGGVFFQSKGVHDHLRPDAKNSAETRRALGIGRKKRGTKTLPAAKCDVVRNIALAKGVKKTARTVLGGGHSLLRPPPLIPDATSGSSHPCTRCLITNCSCRPSLNIDSNIWPTVRSNHDHNFNRHKPIQPCDNQSSTGTVHISPSQQYWMPNNQTSRHRPTENYQSEPNPSHITGGNTFSPNNPVMATTQDVPSHHCYEISTPMCSDVFEPNHIFQLDQPLVRCNSSVGASRSTNPVQQHHHTTQSPPTLLDLGSGTIEHKTFESFFDTNDDSCTTSSSQNNENTECIYANGRTQFHLNTPTTLVQQPYGNCVDRNRGGVVPVSFTNPVAESGDILLEFETANDRLQRRKNQCLVAAGGMNRWGREPNDLMLQGNLGIYLERDEETGYGQVLESNVYNHPAPYAASVHQQCSGQQDYTQYYRLNSSTINHSNNNNNNNNIGRDYVVEQ